MDELQNIIYDMKTIRNLSSIGLIVIDETLRKAGKKGAEVGNRLRTALLQQLKK